MSPFAPCRLATLLACLTLALPALPSTAAPQDMQQAAIALVAANNDVTPFDLALDRHGTRLFVMQPDEQFVHSRLLDEFAVEIDLRYVDIANIGLMNTIVVAMVRGRLTNQTLSLKCREAKRCFRHGHFDPATGAFLPTQDHPTMQIDILLGTPFDKIEGWVRIFQHMLRLAAGT
jgi:hypothetical protein